MTNHMTAEQLRAEQLYASIVDALDDFRSSSRNADDEDYRTYLRGIATLERVAECLSGMAAAPAWQPTESAPKDGTEILACWPKMKLDDDCELTGKVIGYVRTVSSWSCGVWQESAFLEANGSSFGDDWEFAMAPSHWMPIPGAPETPHG